ncbi:hypothetical protein TNCT_486121 [Trichonephila clavata]|uniref:Uncharacterized protein n=1 Tax=Trichonephila clavata TaxID=2740835 RepID=A0A8X6JU93_TRICU|nr:hypothetical protein TNCT_486121 [Trichonephila clavata]
MTTSVSPIIMHILRYCGHTSRYRTRPPGPVAISTVVGGMNWTLAWRETPATTVYLGHGHAGSSVVGALDGDPRVCRRTGAGTPVMVQRWQVVVSIVYGLIQIG